MYAKLFQQVLTSSLTENEPIDVRGVFFMLMAAADKSGNVLGSDITIARIINVPLEQFQKCLESLMKPDPQSRSPEFEGRRVVPLERGLGYLLPGYVKYSGTMTDEQRREYFRVKQAECRARKKEAELALVGEPPPVPPEETPAIKPRFVKPTLDEIKLLAAKSGLPEREAEKFFHHYESCGWKVGKNPMKSVTHSMGGWKMRWEEAGRPSPAPAKRGFLP